MLNDLIQDFDTAMMTTLGRDGHMHSRPMATQKPQPDSPIWFVAAMETAKIEDLQKDPRINLAYYNPGSRAWVSLSGKARLDQDKTRIKQLWQEDWKIWFPDGPEQPGLVLIHVNPETATYWEPEHGRVGTWVEMAKAYVKGEEPKIPEPRTVNSF